METVFVKCGSRRARHRLVSLLGLEPDEYYCILPPTKPGQYFDAPHFFEIPADRLEQARQIKGITKARINPDWNLMKCWQLSN